MTEETTQPHEPQEEVYTVEQKLEILAANVMGLLELNAQLAQRIADIEQFLGGEEPQQEEVAPDGTSH